MTSETWKYLADNYVMGTWVCFAIVFIIYALICIFAQRKRVKVTGNVAVLAMIPVVHIVFLFLGEKKPKPEKPKTKKKKNSDEDEVEDELSDMF